jgi:hypothetical protein
MRTVSFAIALAVSLPLASRASARVPDAPTVSYRAPAACPVEETFLQRLRARLGTSRGAANPARTLDVQITASNGRYVGKLSLAEADGRTTTKTLEAVDCGELVDALSLVAALALAPDDVDGSGRNRSDTPSTASAPTPMTPPPASTPGPGPPAPGSASAPTPASPPVSAASAPGPTPTPVPPSAPGPTPAPASTPGPAAGSVPESASPALETATGSTAPSRLGLALGGHAAVGPAPRALFGAALSVHWVLTGAGVFAPALDIGGAASLSPDAPEAKGTASFAWLTARALVYLVQWPLGAGVVLRAGAAGNVGVLVARGHDTTSPATSARPWASLGAVAGVEVPLGSRFAVHPDVSLEAPLRRDRYAFGSSDFFEVPVVIATGSVSVVTYLR